MKTLLMISNMELPPTLITVLRKKKWVRISSYDLVPGDIC